MKILHNIIQEIDCSLTNNQLFRDSIALLFQERSKYDKFSFIQERGRIALFKNPLVIEKVVKPYKTYPSKKTISLCLARPNTTNPIFKIIESRRSKRRYMAYSISVNELFLILHYSYGITGESNIAGKEGIWPYRAVPSGGALYPLEIYIYLNISSIGKGIYHYRPDNDTLELIHEGDYLQLISQYIAAQNIDLENSSCIVFITSMLQRHMIKYGERGYRFILQEVGAVSQNISLVCQAINLSSCILGGYIDDHINNIIGVNAPMETIQSIIIIGKAYDTNGF